MPQQVFIQIRFREQTEVGEFNDAIYFTESQYASVTQDQIDLEKVSRVFNYVDAIKNAPPPKELKDYTKDELLQFKAEAENQKQEIESRIIELTTAIATSADIEINP